MSNPRDAAWPDTMLVAANDDASKHVATRWTASAIAGRGARGSNACGHDHAAGLVNSVYGVHGARGRGARGRGRPADFTTVEPEIGTVDESLGSGDAAMRRLEKYVGILEKLYHLRLTSLDRDMHKSRLQSAIDLVTCRVGDIADRTTGAIPSATEPFSIEIESLESVESGAAFPSASGGIPSSTD